MAHRGAIHGYWIPGWALQAPREAPTVEARSNLLVSRGSPSLKIKILSGFSREGGWLLFDTPANADNLCVKTEDEWKAFQVRLSNRETCADEGAILTIHNLRLFPASCGFEHCTSNKFLTFRLNWLQHLVWRKLRSNTQIVDQAQHCQRPVGVDT